MEKEFSYVVGFKERPIPRAWLLEFEKSAQLTLQRLKEENPSAKRSGFEYVQDDGFAGYKLKVEY